MAGKYKRRLIKRGMSIVEYSVLIAVVVAALLGIQIYIKRAVCSRWKVSGDVIGFGKQFDHVNTAASGLGEY